TGPLLYVRPRRHESAPFSPNRVGEARVIRPPIPASLDIKATESHSGSASVTGGGLLPWPERAEPGRDPGGGGGPPRIPPPLPRTDPWRPGSRPGRGGPGDPDDCAEWPPATG